MSNVKLTIDIGRVLLYGPFGQYGSDQTEFSMDQLLLRAEEVQKALSLGRSTIYQMMASGELPIVRIGRSVRVPADALRDWVEHQATPISAPGPKER